ncbi:MAG: Stage sporulation protein [Bryobacterales bacterium]|nr:Stage sporulation protein [Bryobacterales bacterium]
MSESVLVDIAEPTDVAQLRRIAMRMADSIGFDETQAGRVAIVATEAGTNMLKHAGRGEAVLRIGEDGGSPSLEILALDQGPGVQDIEKCLADGYTTATSPGEGLGAIRRLSTDADFYSLPGVGTAVLARWRAQHALPAESDRMQLGVVNLMKPGQDVCGDSWGVEQTENLTTILVADGLGHGYDAWLASKEAVRVLHDYPDATAVELLQLVHQALRSSRGAAVAIARIDRGQGEMTFAGLGNIMAQIYDGAEPRQHLVSVNGTAGHQAPKLREFTYPWPRKGMLALFSDGLTTGTGLHSLPGLAFHDPALIAGVLYSHFTRRLDDATIVIARAA